MEMENKFENKKCVWDGMINQYSLSKTLRFELKPVDGNGNYIEQNEAVIFLAEIIKNDLEIKKAYIVLKPILDKIHEQLINDSLNSELAKEIDFLQYYNYYKEKSNLDKEEKRLRNEIVKTFEIGSNIIKEKSGVDSKGKLIFNEKDKGIKILTKSGILKYIEKNILDYTSNELTEKFLLL